MKLLKSGCSPLYPFSVNSVCMYFSFLSSWVWEEARVKVMQKKETNSISCLISLTKFSNSQWISTSLAHKLLERLAGLQKLLSILSVAKTFATRRCSRNGENVMLFECIYWCLIWTSFIKQTHACTYVRPNTFRDNLVSVIALKRSRFCRPFDISDVNCLFINSEPWARLRVIHVKYLHSSSELFSVLRPFIVSPMVLSHLSLSLS